MTTETYKIQVLALRLFTPITMPQQNTNNSVEEWNLTTEGSEQPWSWLLVLQRQGQLQTFIAMLGLLRNPVMMKTIKQLDFI